MTGTGIGNIDLKSFVNTGEFLLISDHEITAIYDEYFLVEFYTDDSLNKNDSPFYGKNVIGIKVVHIDARICYDENGQPAWNGDEAYYTGFLYDNSGTDYLINHLLRQDYSSSMEEYATSDSLYTPSSKKFGINIWNDYKYHSGSALNFSIVVNSMNYDSANITIEIK